VAIDSGFAAAWSLLGATYAEMELRDSMMLAYAQARKYSARLTNAERLAMEATIAHRTISWDTAVARWADVLREDPTNAVAYHDRGLDLRRLGRYDEAVESFRRAMELSPLGGDIYRNSLAITLAPIGRVAEARSVASALRGWLRRDADLVIAIADADWDRADSLATEFLKRGGLRVQAGAVVACTQALRGRVAAAREMFAHTRATMHDSSDDYTVRQKELILALTSGHGPQSATDAIMRDTTWAQRLWNGLWHPGEEQQVFLPLADHDIWYPRAWWFAWSGNLDAAAHELRDARARGLADADPWRERMEILDRAVSTPNAALPGVIEVLGKRTWNGMADNHFEMMTLRWIVADAYERIGRPDSAAAYLEIIVNPTRVAFPGQYMKGCAYPFALHRLARLYDSMGQHRRAATHWQRFLDTFTQPDPEYLPLVQEARAALARRSWWDRLAG
jgi:tetratricopeptide (TPR) repeat protein